MNARIRRCISMGHLGHRRHMTGSRLYTLNDQIRHKAHITNALLNKYPNMDVVLGMCGRIVPDVYEK
jgi:hypothetical protein